MRRRILTCAVSITSSVFNILCYVQKHVQTLMDSGNEEEDTYMCLVQVLDRSEEAMRAVCRIYWKDYECFHYNRPPVCAGN